MSKEIFLKKKELRNWWARIVEEPNFAEVLLHVRSEFIEWGPTEEQLRGARQYEMTLTTLQAAFPTSEVIPGPGLQHHADKEPPKPKKGRK